MVRPHKMILLNETLPDDVISTVSWKCLEEVLKTTHFSALHRFKCKPKEFFENLYTCCKIVSSSESPWDLICSRYNEAYVVHAISVTCMTIQQVYSKCGPRSRIRTTKGFPVDSQSVLTERKSRIREPRSLWKFCNVDPGTESSSTPAFILVQSFLFYML